MRGVLTMMCVMAMTGCGLFGVKGGAQSPSGTATAGSSTQGSDPAVQAPASGSAGAAPITHEEDPSLQGLSLRQRDLARRHNTIFAATLERLERDCGWTPDSAIVWRSFSSELDRDLDEGLNMGFAAWCSMPLDRIGRMCQTGNTDAFTAVQARMNSYRCVFGGEGMHAARFDGEQLVYQVEWDAPSRDRFVDDFFGRNL